MALRDKNYVCVLEINGEAKGQSEARTDDARVAVGRGRWYVLQVGKNGIRERAGVVRNAQSRGMHLSALRHSMRRMSNPHVPCPLDFELRSLKDG